MHAARFGRNQINENALTIFRRSAPYISRRRPIYARRKHVHTQNTDSSVYGYANMYIFLFMLVQLRRATLFFRSLGVVLSFPVRRSRVKQIFHLAATNGYRVLTHIHTQSHAKNTQLGKHARQARCSASPSRKQAICVFHLYSTTQFSH